MVHLYIASMRAFSGKSLITLGLGLMLREKGVRIGYMKPLGTIPLHQDDLTIDADADFMRKALGITDPVETVSPFVATPEARSDAFKGKGGNRFETVRKAIEAVEARDIFLIGGGADLFEGSFFGVNGIRLINYLGAKTLVVEPWNGDGSVDSIMGARELLGEHFTGAVINRVPESAHDYVKHVVAPYLEKKNIPVLAILHKDILLDSISVRQLNEILNGTVRCCEEALDDFIESFSIGAMDVDSAFAYFKRSGNKAVITGANRADIQQAALETSTRCVVLTGGMYINGAILKKAEEVRIPVISVNEDTFTAVEKIESVLGKIRIREQKKVQKTKEIVEKEFDFERLLKALEL